MCNEHCIFILCYIFMFSLYYDISSAEHSLRFFSLLSSNNSSAQYWPLNYWDWLGHWLKFPIFLASYFFVNSIYVSNSRLEPGNSESPSHCSWCFTHSGFICHILFLTMCLFIFQKLSFVSVPVIPILREVLSLCIVLMHGF